MDKDSWSSVGYLKENTWGRVANLRIGSRIFLDNPRRSGLIEI